LNSHAEEVSERPAPKNIFRLALMAHQAGHLDEARNGYLYVLTHERDNADALCLLATVLHKSGDSDRALVLARRALTLRQSLMTWCALGTIARDKGLYAEAENAYRKVIELAPDNAEAHHDLAIILRETERLIEAEAAYRRAIALKPKFATAHNNLGVLLKKTGRLAEAEAAYRRALEANADYPEAHNNLGVLYKESDCLNEAEAAYRRAIMLKPDYADACWNLALVLLAQGRYREGWACYEARYHSKRSEAVSEKPKLSCAQWQGESLVGKSLVVWTEQGHGDYVQFARYLPLLKQRGLSRLTVACAPALKPLLATVDGVDDIVVHRQGCAEHDFWVFPLSLPVLFESSLDTLPATLPYVHALPERVAKWRQRVSSQARKVGLIWKGNPGHNNDANRSLSSLSMLAPLWKVPNVVFFSLQKGSGEDQASAASAQQPIGALGQDIGDFADTAAIVTLLDLVICVDTAVAHIAGALGKPCWVLLPHAHSGCDWRWLRARSDSPWYPNTMRLFRQKRPGRWDETIDEVAAHLSAWALADDSPAS
jgi:tetratricopeptide (TPR) repeat protein